MTQRTGLGSLALLGAFVCGLSGCGVGNDAADDQSVGAVMRLPAPGSGSGAASGGDIDSPAPGPGKPNPYPPASDNCSYTQGYWKNHPSAWPVSELRLGATLYTKDQLLAIFHTPVKGNGLIAMAHQLIAARLNLALGATPQGLEASLARADALIGALVVPPVGKDALPTTETAQTNDELAAFNEGKTGPGHCGDGQPPSKPPVDGGTPPPPPVQPPTMQPPVTIE
jgi:hypothetical protein